MISPGDILHFENFEFDDGTVRNKFFVVLHENPLLMLVATSRSIRYPMVKTKGCHPEKMTFFIPVGTLSIFPKPTYLVMTRIYEIPKDAAKKNISGGQITKNVALPTKLFLSIKDCLQNFRDDIADTHWDLIFSPKTPSKASLAALADKFKS